MCPLSVQQRNVEPWKTTRSGYSWGHQTVDKAEKDREHRGREGGRGGSHYRQGDEVAEEGNNKLLQIMGGKRNWECKLGRAEDATCQMCKEEGGMPDHIVFRCRKVKRLKMG